ncbi:zinc ribbon domain-containing protein [uncultured Clostridium sp.]|uniref:zinc ribbon domain-containing protein n=1 Tax=uncultured Clostridium sp. TaxID=59620 RepID=UPI0025ED8544|nr:zinc ribbon domain-containing protein [uncultured Clostridium sp.]
MENMNYCQSCAMPMGGEKDLLGTNADGSKNEEYCKYCFKDGEFIADISMDEMIEDCIPHVVNANSNFTEDSARSMMKEVFPKLKRWSK